MNFRQRNVSIKSLAATTVLGAFLAACSGGGVESNSSKLATPTNNPSTPKPITSTVPPPISSGPTNVGASGNEVIDDIAAGQTASNSKLDALSAKLDSIAEDSSDASSNSNWAKWLGIGIAGYLALQGIHNGVQMAATGEGTGDKIGKFFKGAIFNTDTDRVASDTKGTVKQSEDRVQANVSGWGDQSVAAGLQAKKQAEEATTAGNNAGQRAENAVAEGTEVVSERVDAVGTKVESIKNELVPKMNALIVQANDTNQKVSEIQASGATSKDIKESTKDIGDKVTQVTTDIETMKTDFTAALKARNLSDDQVQALRTEYETKLDAKSKELNALSETLTQKVTEARLNDIRAEAERTANAAAQAQIDAAKAAQQTAEQRAANAEAQLSAKNSQQPQQPTFIVIPGLTQPQGNVSTQADKPGESQVPDEDLAELVGE